MTLSDLLPSLPLTYEAGCQYGLMFSEDLARRITEVQEEVESRFRVSPRPLGDGLFLLRGDLLSEVGPGGLYAQGFAALNPQRFDEIEVLPWAAAVALLPPDPGEV
jgi:hypothetical protein